VKFSYYPETDTLYIDLLDRPGAGVLEIADDFVVDVDGDGIPVGMEIEHASQHTNLLHLEVEGLSLDLDLETSRKSKTA
jgi:uncharacterized protein YuzE